MPEPEGELRRIIETALDQHHEENYAGDTKGAADAIMAALADEFPDGYADLLRCVDGPARRQRVRCDGVGQPTAPCGLVGRGRAGLCPVCGEKVAADTNWVAREHSRWPAP